MLMKFALLICFTSMPLALADWTPIAWDICNACGGTVSQGLTGTNYTAPNTSNWHSQDSFGIYSRSGGAPASLLDDSLADPADILGIVQQDDEDDFFGIADTENSKNSGAISATWQFNIDGATDLGLAIDIAAIGNFEDSGPEDYIKITSSIDNGSTDTLIRTGVDESKVWVHNLADGSQQCYEDPLTIPASNSMILTNEFQTIEVPINGAGSLITITLEAVLNGGSEAVALRNLKILADDGNGMPAPTPHPSNTCPDTWCSDDSVTTTVPYGTSGCTLQAIPLQTHVHTNGDILVELLGPQNPADAADLVIAAPHGGELQNSMAYGVRDENDASHCPSSGCVVDSDKFTKDLALHLQQAFINNYCKVPYVVVMHLHREHIDANRAADGIDQACHGENVICHPAHQAFHDYISLAQSNLQATFGTSINSQGQEGINALLFDMHGYGGTDWVPKDGDQLSSQYGAPFIQWGYRISDDSLDPDSYCPLDSRSCDIGTLSYGRFLPSQPANAPLECLVRGPAAIGSRLPVYGGGPLDLCGASLPSKDYPSPKEYANNCTYCDKACGQNPSDCHYYSGGFDLEVHERLNWETGTGHYMNGVQAEMPRCIRYNSTLHEDLSDDLSVAVMSFLRDLHGPLPGTTQTPAPSTPPLASESPSLVTSFSPSSPPSRTFSDLPSSSPSIAASSSPSSSPSRTFSDLPSSSPSIAASSSPSSYPSLVASQSPSIARSEAPSTSPSVSPSDPNACLDFEAYCVEDDQCCSGVCMIVRTPLAWDICNACVNNSEGRISYVNIWDGAFSSSSDAFGLYSRANNSIPSILRDDSLSGPDSYGIVDENDNGWFFGIADTVNSNTNNDGLPINASWQFDINGAVNLELRVDVAAIGNFEGPSASSPMDFFSFSVSVDGGPQQDVISTETDTSASQTYTLADGTNKNYDDPLKIGDQYLTNKFQTVTSPINGTGTILTVILRAVANGSYEAMAFRNLFVYAEDIFGQLSDNRRGGMQRF